jgi:hypothetical protein
MVSAIRLVTSVLASATLLTACGTLEDNAWTNGVSREEALDLRQFVVATKGAHEVYSYGRDYEGDILISTDVGSWKAHRIGRKWVLTDVVFVS